jgi:hypothetical protein
MVLLTRIGVCSTDVHQHVTMRNRQLEADVQYLRKRSVGHLKHVESVLPVLHVTPLSDRLTKRCVGFIAFDVQPVLAFGVTWRPINSQKVDTLLLVLR